jgi:putative FmdB family regulatory protein
MPLFQYECKNCHAEAEVLVRGKEKPACPACGSKKLHKLLSTVRPMSASSTSAAAESCGMTNCCRMQGGCGMN